MTLFLIHFNFFTTPKSQKSNVWCLKVLSFSQHLQCPIPIIIYVKCPISILQNSWRLEILSELPLFELDSKVALTRSALFNKTWKHHVLLMWVELYNTIKMHFCESWCVTRLTRRVFFLSVTLSYHDNWECHPCSNSHQLNLWWNFQKFMKGIRIMLVSHILCMCNSFF